MSRIPLPKSAPARAGLAVLAILLGINVIGALIDAVAPSPSGPASSSFATKPQGLAAWAELAKRNGIRVRALRDSPADATLGGEGTIAVMDAAALSRDEARALRTFAEGGGRVIAGGEPHGWTRTLLDAERHPSGTTTARRPRRLPATEPETAGVARVKTSGDGRWKDGRRARRRRGLAADRAAARAAGGSRCSPTPRRSRTGCSTRTTTPPSRSR